MEEINLIDIFQYFKAKLVWILVTVLTAVILGNTYTLVTRVPMYKSNTTIVLVSEKKESYSQSDLYVNQNLVGTYSEIIKSRKVLDQVTKNLKLDYTIKELSSNVSVSAVGETEIIKIEVADENATDAMNIANEIAKVFAKEIKDIYNLENVAIVDKAVEADNAFNLTYVKDNLIYIMIGIILSSGVIFMFYYFDTTIKSADTIEEKLGLTVLAVVPYSERVK